nr:MAG TPA: RNA ligase [Caudoviricetes sp.]
MLKEYHKIETLFERDEKTKKLVEGKYRNEAIKYLKDNQWQFTEKIDGTNIRIYWDGHRVSFYGRTDKAQIPANLMNRLVELFGGETNEQLFEQKFGETEVILYGEGYGEKIQNGGLYRKGQDFILFDVMIADNYQSRESVEDIAKYFGIDIVPIILEGTLQEAVNYVKSKPKSSIGAANSEGVVGRPVIELQDRCGKRIIVKIKVRDFERSDT